MVVVMMMMMMMMTMMMMVMMMMVMMVMMMQTDAMMKMIFLFNAYQDGFRARSRADALHHRIKTRQALQRTALLVSKQSAPVI